MLYVINLEFSVLHIVSNIFLICHIFLCTNYWFINFDLNNMSNLFDYVWDLSICIYVNVFCTPCVYCKVVQHFSGLFPMLYFLHPLLFLFYDIVCHFWCYLMENELILIVCRTNSWWTQLSCWAKATFGQWPTWAFFRKGRKKNLHN